MDQEYDEAEAAVKEAEKALAEHLKELKAELGSRDVKYASLNKESHVIEVPEVSLGFYKYINKMHFLKISTAVLDSFGILKISFLLRIFLC